MTVSCPKLIDILVHSPSTQTGEQQKKQNSFEGQTSDTSSNRGKHGKYIIITVLYVKIKWATTLNNMLVQIR